MQQLIKALPSVLRAAEQSEEVKAAACFTAWNHTAGDVLRAHATPIELSGRTLVVAVRDAVWQKQLQKMIPQFVPRLNFILGQPLVGTIEFAIAPDALPEPPASSKHETAETELSFELHAAASGIKDPSLRRAFLGAANSCLRRDRT